MSTKTIVLLATLLMAAMAVSGQEAAPPPTTSVVCGAELGLCAAALREGVKPSEKCCTSLELSVKSHLPCLCAFLTNPPALAGFNLTVANALLIPKSCGIDAGPSMCSVAKAPSPHGVAPVPGPSKHDKGDATKLAGTGLVGIVLMTISMIFY